MKEPKRMELPREVWMGPHVLQKTSGTCRRLSLGSKGYLVADEQTYEIAGKEIEESLSKANIQAERSLISRADAETVEKVQKGSENSDFLLGVGGGTCIDVAKFASFKGGKPFISVPTAASHDGISSARASIKGGEKPTSVQAQAPLAIVADTLVIRDSPSPLTAAGCGDMIANYTAVLDWDLARREKEEYYSEYAAALSRMSAKLVAENAGVIKEGSEESARKIVKALISSGVAMSIAGSSRPASGSEHLFSHALDQTASEPALHGEQCAVGSIMMMNMHGEDWESMREALKTVGCPTNSQELGIDPESIIEALTKAHEIRPERYTILRDGIGEKEAKELAEETEVI